MKSKNQKVKIESFSELPYLFILYIRMIFIANYIYCTIMF